MSTSRQTVTSGRALRDQTNRFLVGTGALLTLLLTVQQLLAGA